MSIIDFVHQEVDIDEVKKDAEAFAKGLPDRDYQMGETFQSARKDLESAQGAEAFRIEDTEAFLIEDAEAFAKSLPDKK
jgi:hypothetical protein